MLGWLENYGPLLLHGLILMALFCAPAAKRWQHAERLLTAHCVVAVGLLASVALWGDLHSSAGWFNTTGVSMVLMVLISFIGLIVCRYAHRHLAGEPDNGRFLSWYLCTLLAVGITVSSNHLLIFLLGWVGISLSLHQLLLFYPERPRAALAAHKKFLFARLSECLLLMAFGLLYLQHQTFDISAMLAHYQASPALTTMDQFIALLIVAVALIKCAQLPLHGWLIQVVESPTPVSALLHAGIINLGGFLLLTFAPLIALATLATWLVLVVAGLSCVMAALVMMTRISIKVRLAWSTVAQMGLMLIECALGLYELALLHLIAHSCYKAHAFLGAGEAVNHHVRRLYVETRSPQNIHWVAALGCVGVVAGVTLMTYGWPAMFSPWVLIAIAITTWLAFFFSSPNPRAVSHAIGMAAVGLLAYLLFSGVLAAIAPTPPLPHSPIADAWVSALFIGLFIIHWLHLNPGRFKSERAWFIALNAGFYLDEWATRITLRLWPVDLPARHAKQLDLEHDALPKKASLTTL